MRWVACPRRSPNFAKAQFPVLGELALIGPDRSSSLDLALTTHLEHRMPHFQPPVRIALEDMSVFPKICLR